MARFLLLALGGRSAKYAAGDVDAEFAERSSLGMADARSWYWSQVLRSIPPLVAMEYGRGDSRIAALAVLIASAFPLMLLDAGWSFVLSQIPLKAGAARGVDFVVTSLAIQFVISGCAGLLRPPAWCIPAGYFFWTLAGTSMRGVPPDCFGAASCLAMTIGMVSGYQVRRRWA